MKAKNDTDKKPVKKDRAAYFRRRRWGTLSIHLTDSELKDKLKIVAKLDNRTVSGWLTHYALPAVIKEVEFQLELARKKGLSVD